MVNFGFTFNPSSRLNLDNVDNELLSKIIAEEPDFAKCISCGSCSASCSATEFSPTSLRRAIAALRGGDKDKAISELQNCLLCGKCSLVCPREINTRHLILTILKICSKK